MGVKPGNCCRAGHVKMAEATTPTVIYSLPVIGIQESSQSQIQVTEAQEADSETFKNDTSKVWKDEL